MSFSPVSLKFEVDLECQDMLSKAIMSGKILVVDLNSLATPEVQEDLEDMEQVSGLDVYSSLAQVGYQLGDEFHTIRRLLVGKNGTYCTILCYTG